MQQSFSGGLEVMAHYTVPYRGSVLAVDLLQETRGCPEFFFLVRTEAGEFLLSKQRYKDRTIWLCGNGLDDRNAVGEAIENSIGFRLPLKETNNPFLYRGDRTVKIAVYRVGGAMIERARAPFNQDVYYRVCLRKGRWFTLLRMTAPFWDSEPSWYPADGTNLADKDLAPFRSLLEAFEDAYQKGIYKAVQVVEK